MKTKYTKDKNLKLHMRISKVELEALKKRSKELNMPVSKIIRDLAINPFILK